MTTAITALGPSMEDRVDDRFGRARYILLVGDDGELLESIDNSENRNAMQGAGIGTAELVSRSHAGAVITGHLGPKAFSALSSAGIAGFAGSGLSAREAFGSYRAGELGRLDEAAPAHSG